MTSRCHTSLPLIYQTSRHTEDRQQTDRQTNRHTDKQTHRQTDKQTDRHTDTQTDRQTDNCEEKKGGSPLSMLALP